MDVILFVIIFIGIPSLAILAIFRIVKNKIQLKRSSKESQMILREIDNKLARLRTRMGKSCLVGFDTFGFMSFRDVNDAYPVIPSDFLIFDDEKYDIYQIILSNPGRVSPNSLPGYITGSRDTDFEIYKKIEFKNIYEIQLISDRENREKKSLLIKYLEGDELKFFEYTNYQTGCEELLEIIYKKVSQKIESQNFKFKIESQNSSKSHDKDNNDNKEDIDIDEKLKRIDNIFSQNLINEKEYNELRKNVLSVI